jgi:hypothetical protein
MAMWPALLGRSRAFALCGRPEDKWNMFACAPKRSSNQVKRLP